jgi:hypothetical protein
MSSKTTARKNLKHVDPGTFTPHFAWKKSPGGAGREVYCEGLALAEIAEKYGTPTYVYSRAAMEEAVDELKEGLGGSAAFDLFCCEGERESFAVETAGGAGMRV